MANTAVNTVTRLLRLAAAVVTFTAALVLRSAHQTANFPDSSIHVDFNDITPYWCFLFANFVAAVYSFLVAILPHKSLLWRFVVATDVVLFVIISSSCSAALAVAFMENNGNFHARWSPICLLVPSYCRLVFVAIIIGYIGVVLYLLLHLFSIQAALNALLVD